MTLSELVFHVEFKIYHPNKTWFPYDINMALFDEIMKIRKVFVFSRRCWDNQSMI